MNPSPLLIPALPVTLLVTEKGKAPVLTVWRLGVLDRGSAEPKPVLPSFDELRRGIVTTKRASPAPGGYVVPDLLFEGSGLFGIAYSISSTEAASLNPISSYRIVSRISSGV